MISLEEHCEKYLVFIMIDNKINRNYNFNVTYSLKKISRAHILNKYLINHAA